MPDARLLCAAVLFTLALPAAGLLPTAAQGQTADAAPAGQPQRFVIAAMRRDGVALPFAAYDDGDWSAPWPTSIREVEIPANLEAVPGDWWGGAAPGSWSLWRADSSTPVPLTPRGAIVVLVGRARRIGIRTDYASPAQGVPPSELPYPKDGLAVTGGVKVEPLSTVSRLVENWRTLPTLLHDDIETAERRMVDGIRSNTKWRHPFNEEQRSKIPVTLETWYTTSLEQPGFSVSYIEAVKKYPPEPGDEGCGLETFISGWVHHNMRNPKPRSVLGAHVTYCDREGVSYMLPFGVIRVGNRTHWAFQMSSWEREWYAVVQAVPGRVRYVAEYYGGGTFPE